MMERRRTRRVAFASFVVATVAYLAWRACCTLNPDAPVYTWMFLALEAYAAVCAITFYAITVDRDTRTPPPARPGRSVDILICTYNEPAALLRQTIRRALAVRYPHTTCICDDGRRPEIRALAAELGCEYITRDQNHHYKAGNLNNALAHTTGELLLVLDADHLVRPEIVETLLGYFDDDRVALVQTPQVFYNLDSFQHHFRPKDRKLWHEGAIFHHAMQPGASRWNAAFFVGTGAMLRRSAIEKIGGFATGSVTEDAFTSMRLHAAGFRSAYHDAPLGYLIAPESLHQYLTQRLRWGQGSMQILRLQNPLVCRGLSFAQRVVYTAALSSFSQALVHLAYYLAPALFLLGGPAPLRADEAYELAPIVAHIAFDLVFFKLWLGPLARPLVAECFKFLNVYVFIKALGGYFMRSGRLAFKVTTKGRDGETSMRLLLPQVVLLVVNMTAFGYGVIRLTSTSQSLVGVLGIGIATAFAGSFVLIGGMTLLFAHARIAADREYTFPDRIAAELVGLADGMLPATVLRANDRELFVLCDTAAGAVGDTVVTRLHLDDTAPLVVHGRVVRTTPVETGILLQVALVDVAPAAADRLFDRFIEHSLPDLVDRSLQRWRSSARPRAQFDSSPYLPIQTDVL